jgi:hypothetical protein
MYIDFQSIFQFALTGALAGALLLLFVYVICLLIEYWDDVLNCIIWITVLLIIFLSLASITN